MAESGKERRWELRIADDLAPELADRIGAFVSGFAPPDDPDGRRDHSGAYYHWKLQQNPAGRGYVSLAMDGERIVGTTTITRKFIYLRGQLVPAAEIGDTFTDPQYQRMGIFSSLVSATRERAVAAGVTLIYGTPNTNSLPGYERNLSFRQKNGLDLRLCLLPLRPAAVMNSRPGRQGRVLPEAPIDGIAKVYLRASTGLFARACREEPLTFDEEFDVLDARLKDRHVMCSRRQAGDLAYRLAQNPDASRYRLITCRDGRGRLQGYVVCKHARQHGLPILWVADSAALTSSVETKLWFAAVRAGIEGRFPLLAAWLPRRMGTWLMRLPAPPAAIHPVPVIFYDHGLGHEALSPDVSLRFSILDSDNL